MFLKSSTREIPQADTLENVVDTVFFVAKGFDSFQLIAKKLGLTKRQGRYYRLAAELLGLIKRPKRNRAVLTQLGKDFLDANNQEKRSILFEQVFKIPIIQTVIGLLVGAKGSILQEEVSNILIEAIKESTQQMIKRRLKTILSWLLSLGIVTQNGSLIKLVDLPHSINYIKIHNLQIPVLLKVDDYAHLKRVGILARSQFESINEENRLVAFERENLEHEKIISLISKRLRENGIFSIYNDYIDLAARIDNNPYLFEAKVLNSDSINQTLRGIQQLLHYRSLQSSKDSKLVLLTEKNIPIQNKRIQNFLLKQKILHLEVDLNKNRIYSSINFSKELEFLID